MYNLDSRNFIILLIAGMAFLSLLIGSFFWYKTGIKEYISFELNITNENITINSKSINKIIRVNQIKSIYKDMEGNIYIKYTKFNRLRILKYIENMIELENLLSNIKTIEQLNRKIDIIQYIPAFLFIGIIYINRTGNMFLYIIFAIGIVLSSIYSCITLLMGGFKDKIIISLLFNLFLVVIFSRNIIYAINYIKNR
jgi:hypothetical protein